MAGTITEIPPLVRARIVERAATLDERIAASSPGGAVPPEAAVAALGPWIQAFSAGDHEAFLRRLDWDGLDLASAHAAVGGPLRLHSAPEWLEWLERFVTEAAADPAPLAQDEPPALPFVELWLPVARAARAQLRRRAGRDIDTLAPLALAALERRLLQEASSLAEQAAFERFRAGLAATGSDSVVSDAPSERRAYDDFVRRMRAGDLVGFFTEYPVIARLLGTLAETWVSTSHELLQRLEADRPLLEARFAAGRRLGRVESIEPAMGDRHHGGRRVMALTFAAGIQLVYKPRDVGVERAFSAFVDWGRRQGLDLPPPLAVLALDGYGWIEFARNGDLTSVAQARGYFRRAGALVCLAHVLRGRDLHMENVVATTQGPQLVDTEMLLQPESADGAATDGDSAAGPSVQESCLGSGLVSLLQADGQGGLFDIGGLRGAGGGRAPVARRIWRALGSDAIHFAREPRFAPTVTNRVLLDGRPLRPDDFAADVVAGFEHAYGLLLAHKEALLAPEGPLSGFAGQPVRVLFRTSTQYGALQYVLTSPQYQRSGLRRSFAMDSLNRCFAGERERPPTWPLVADERHSLERLDIPRFTIDSSATSVRSQDGATIEGKFTRSGFASVRARVRALCEDDLALQAEFLAGALANPVDACFDTPAPAAASPAEDAPRLIEHALWIGRELLQRSEPTADGPRWPTPPFARSRSGIGPLRLYDGASGPALFLAALGSLTGEAEFREAARAALRGIAASAGGLLRDDDPIGGASGIGSVAYALGLGAHFLDEPGLLQAALELARSIGERRLAADQRLDVVGGTAGAALALLALHRLSGEGWLVDRALACAARLEAAAVAPDVGVLAWPAADGRLLAGMGHGAAGIACALARVAAASGEQRLLEAARAGCAYERSLFSAAERNWPVVGGGSGGGPSLMAAWCHGAPGIGLARVLSPGLLDEPWLLEDVEAAMATSAEAAQHGNDHLCCGRLGRAEALLTAGLQLGRTPWVEAARACALQVAARAREQRRFSLPSSEFECRPYHPGFFRGLAGVGYQLLRTAAPAQVPSVLGWQAAERIGERT